MLIRSLRGSRDYVPHASLSEQLVERAEVPANHFIESFAVRRQLLLELCVDRSLLSGRPEI